jgi:hypothetical protein
MYIDANDCIQFTPFDTLHCLLDRQLEDGQRLQDDLRECQEIVREAQRLIDAPES